jgi:hypothetical protein
LIAAALIYYAWRTPALAMFGWAESLGLGGAIAALRLHAAAIVLPDAVLSSVPDALWQPQWTEESARELCTTLSTMTWMPGDQ